MNGSNRIFLVLVVFSGVIFLTSCSTGILKYGSNAVENAKVDLEVDTSADELWIPTRGSSRCKAVSPKPGCIAVGKLNSGRVRFKLQKSAGWHLTEFKICLGDTKAGQVCNLQKWQQNQFSATDKRGTVVLFPDATGVIDLTSLPNNHKEFYLVNLNLVKQDYFYTIEACRTNNGAKCVDTDPPIENGGRN